MRLEGDDLRFETEPASRKYKNLVRDPRVSVCVFGQPKWGVVLRGTATVLAVDERGQAQVLVHPTSKSSWRRKEG